jgi:hypothetical protein
MMKPTCDDFINVVFNFVELASSDVFEKHVGFIFLKLEPKYPLILSKTIYQ